MRVVALENLTDALELYPVDDLLFNMFGNPSTDYSGRSEGPCQCEACRARFHARYGRTLPTTGGDRDYGACMSNSPREVAASFDGLRLNLSGSEFGADWNVMSLKLDGDGAYVNATDPPIWERPTPDTDLLIDGEGAGSVLRDGSITFAFLGIVDYCPSVDRAESREWKCDLPRIRCESNHHRLRLTPK